MVSRLASRQSIHTDNTARPVLPLNEWFVPDDPAVSCFAVCEAVNERCDGANGALGWRE